MSVASIEYEGMKRGSEMTRDCSSSGKVVAGDGGFWTVRCFVAAADLGTS